MVKLVKLTYKNILSVGDMPITINLNMTPTTTIIGESGSGKSIFLDALFFALFGVPYRDFAKNDLINTVNGKGLLVQLDLYVKDTQVSIERGIKPNIFSIAVNGKPLEQHGDSRDFQKYLESTILGFNKVSFSQVAVMSIMDFVPFLTLPVKVRTEIVENLLDISMFSSIGNALSKQYRPMKQEKDVISGQLKVLASSKESLSVMLNSMSANNDSIIESKLKSIAELEKSLAFNMEEKAKVESNIIELYRNNKDERFSKAIETLLVVSKELDILVNDVKRLTKDVEFYKNNTICPTCHSCLDSNSDHVTEIKETLNQTKQKTIQTKAKKDELISIKAVYDKNEEHISSLDVSRMKFNSEIASINNQLRLHENELQSLTKANDELVDQQRQQLDVVVAELLALTNKLAEIEHQYNHYVEAYNIIMNSGIRETIIDQYIPLLNKEINRYLEILDLPVNFTLDKDFNEKILSRFRDSFTYNHFSAGERSRINFALVFAWRYIAKLKNSIDCNLLVIDELLDSGLSDNLIPIVLHLLKEMGKQNNIFLITHRHTRQASELFDRTLSFTKNGNFTEVSESLV